MNSYPHPDDSFARLHNAGRLFLCAVSAFTPQLRYLYRERNEELAPVLGASPGLARRRAGRSAAR